MFFKKINFQVKKTRKMHRTETRTGRRCFWWTGPRDGRKRSGEDRRAEDWRNTPTSSNSGATWAKGHLLPFLRRSPETEDVHTGPRDDARAGKRAGAVSRLARRRCRRRPGGRRCDTGHDDPGLQPADFLRRYMEQQKINVIPIKTAVAVHAPRGQRALGGPPSACTCVWFHLETNMPKCRRANLGC